MNILLLPDALWNLIQPMLPSAPRRPNGGRPRLPDRACLTGITVCPTQWNSLGDAATRVGMRLRHDVLAKAARLAGTWYLGSDPLRPAGLAGSLWAN